jgi:hypothetical protein
VRAAVTHTCPGRLPVSWEEIEAVAAQQDWALLSQELSLKLNDAKLKLERMQIPIDFIELGFRILRVLAVKNPKGSMAARFAQLSADASQLLTERHQMLPHVMKCSERMQALLAKNTSAAWAELASILRKELNKPAWALEAATVALKKDSHNLAGFATKIAAHGDLGDFRAAHRAHNLAVSRNPNNRYVAAAIAKVELRERRFEASLSHALISFMTEPRAASARQIGNIYREAGLSAQARYWFGEAGRIETRKDAHATRAHLDGLVKLARLSEREG